MQIFRTENGDAERHLPSTHEEHELLAGAAHDLVRTLREATGYTFQHSCVMLMRGGDSAKVGLAIPPSDVSDVSDAPVAQRCVDFPCWSGELLLRACASAALVW